MNLDLAAIYNTPGAHTSEDLEKAAALDLFTKVASEAGIDLNALTDDQVSSLYEQTMGKQASDEHKEHEKKEDKLIAGLKKEQDKEEGKDDDEKKAAAEAEFAVQKDWQEKQAEADYLGRLMAHAYVAELNEIKEASVGDHAKAFGAKATELANKVRGHADATVGKAKGHFEAAKGKAGEHLESVGKKVMHPIGGGAEHKMHPTTAKRVGGGAYAAGGAAAAGAAHHFGKKKESSAIDELALEEAVKMAHEGGWDFTEAAERITAVSTLGLGESTKIASASDTEGAVQIRALEYLEAAGYPVTWDQG